jgi:catechol 2,3-dioxygenase-like lactoylglutathione lyase family enzyme
MKLAKPCIDIGLYSEQKEAQFAFWQNDIGLPYEEMVKLGGGQQQHRHSLNGSVLKLNHSRNPLPTARQSGYEELLIARADITAPITRQDPDGNRVTLVPMNYAGVTAIGVRLVVSNLARFVAFYRDILQIEQVSDTSFRWGTTLLMLREDTAQKPDAGIQGQGFRYLTVQVWQVDVEHEAFLARGGQQARPPTTLGTTARISFLYDPDLNWIEVSQRASLTGDLPGELARS